MRFVYAVVFYASLFLSVLLGMLLAPYVYVLFMMVRK